MGNPTFPLLSILSILLLYFSVSWAASDSIHESFLHCLSLQSDPSLPISTVVYTPNSSSYSSIFESNIGNIRFLSANSLKPQFIITPLTESHVQAAVICSRIHDLQIRSRSGGHDYEGLSYVSEIPFVIVDMANLRSIHVDIEDNSAWVQADATIGEVYYKIAEKSRIHGFPSGFCPSVAAAGHFSGGGYGTLMRKFGLSADNIVDAYLVDVRGRILNRESMGEDLFWAIRGGGGASYGIILSWKIRLVPVPPTVTVFTVSKTIEEGATELVNRWQYIADKVHEDLFIRVILILVNSGQSGRKTGQAQFNSLFLGGVDKLLPLMNESFPELGLKRSDCIEMSWIESTVYFSGSSNLSLEVLLDRRPQSKRMFKAKSDYVKEPIPEIGIMGIWKRFHQVEDPVMILNPYGGRMSEIAESAIPFPHRKGNKYKIQYLVYWEEKGIEASQKHIGWIRNLYSYMTPYVSKSPREAYLNYRDLDLGTNNIGNTSYLQASVWGHKYFKNNFQRLIDVKTKVDPSKKKKNRFCLKVSYPT
uniref:FAD-binding PCMH-type domain-containing protein n=1 Tax=Nelumbo nucifera TaxID=4432 RepID=A0A822XJB2_NELNU|nr:TPA_asm: hypothetical protein HUJ06_020704 [Nelumbo nucifera]